MNTEEIVSLANVAIKIVPLIITLINSIGIIVENNKDLSDSQKQELIALIDEAKLKVSELKPLS